MFSSKKLYSSATVLRNTRLSFTFDSIYLFEQKSFRRENKLFNDIREKTIVAVINNNIPFK
jgi:hypothetical protein